MFKYIILSFVFLSLSANAFLMTGSQVNAVEIAPGAVVLDADTSGRYVGNITASGGVATTGAADGEDISHGLSVDQSFEPTWTGIQTFSPSGTKDVIINTDADSNLRIVGTSSAVGTFLCLDGSDNVVDCTMANSIALTTDTTGNYVGTLVAGTGISTTGASSGEGIAHSVSVDQSFSPTWTGQHTFFGSGAYTGTTYVIDQAGDPSAKQSLVLYTTTGMSPGDLAAVDFALIDTANSTGGQMARLNVMKTGSGTVDVAAVVAGVGVFPVVTLTGTLPAGPEQAWLETTGPAYTDATTNFGTAATDSTLFNLDNDCVYVGNDATYYEIQVTLATVASANIMPTFAYSTVAGFTTFAPNDGTAGFTRNGNINFDKQTIIDAGWAARSVNGVSKFYIRICRTENTVVTDAVEDTILLTDGTVNQWAPTGTVTIQKIVSQGSATNTIAGRIQMNGVVSVHTTCDANAVGLFEMYDDSANHISLCVCEKTGVASYAWAKPTGGAGC